MRGGTGGLSDQQQKRIVDAYKKLYRQGGTLLENARKLAEQLEPRRGEPATADTEALVEAIVRLAALAVACPEIAECDVNPLFVMDEGGGCVAVDARIRIGE
mgnify:CR=1 FL=1